MTQLPHLPVKAVLHSAKSAHRPQSVQAVSTDIISTLPTTNANLALLLSAIALYAIRRTVWSAIRALNSTRATATPAPLVIISFPTASRVIGIMYLPLLWSSVHFAVTGSD